MARNSIISGGGLAGGGGGGGTANPGPSLPRRGRGGINAGLPAAGGGGGGHKRPDRPNRPNNRPDRKKKKDPEDPATPPESTDTGLGSDIFNDPEHSLAGIRGLMQQGGMNLDSGNPFMASWMAQQAEGLNNDYLAASAAGTRGTEWTISDYLNERFGGAVEGQDLGGHPIPPAIAAYYRQKWNNLNPEARNYFSEQWTGPGRVIAG